MFILIKSTEKTFLVNLDNISFIEDLDNKGVIIRTIDGDFIESSEPFKLLLDRIGKAIKSQH